MKPFVWSFALKFLGATALLGLTLGLLAGALTGRPVSGTTSLNASEPWSRGELPIEALMGTLLTSEHWRRGEVIVEEAAAELVAEPEPEVPGRPGVFKHLELVAIQRKPRLEALLKPVKMPDAQREVMLSSVNEAGFIEVELNTVIAEGWVVSGISDTYLEVTGLASGEVVEYRLFQWN